MSFRKGRIILYAPIILGVCIVFFTYLPPSTTERLLQTSDQIKTRDLTHRVDIWTAGLSAFEDTGAYIFGTGFKTFRKLLDLRYGSNSAPHNTYLSTLIELGVIGLIIYFAMIIYLLRKVLYLCKNDSLYYFLLIIPLMLAMFTLGIETRRWLFLIGVLIIKIWQFSKEGNPIHPSLTNET